MPQMSPMNWGFLFITFIFILICSMIVIYFNVFTQTIINQMNKSSTNILTSLSHKSWKW
uniref:ATPase 8 n=1 Tax=Gomphiocephalus hodgsoni TaxID=221270 RepID=Q85QR1_GOMHO|nr:ATP synthase F0 subunit 8 [Gomphiocephalus hodgsoni]AAO43661.1 ATPase 8 [Gomphiocephalus hodgsoni]